MRGGDKDRTTGVSSLANEEPLVVVEACIDVMGEVVREDGSDGRDSVVRKGKTSLRRGGSRSVHEWLFRAEDRDVGHGWSGGSHRGSEIFAAGRSDEHVVGVNGDILVKRGEEKGIENLLSDLGRSGRHC